MISVYFASEIQNNLCARCLAHGLGLTISIKEASSFVYTESSLFEDTELSIQKKMILFHPLPSYKLSLFITKALRFVLSMGICLMTLIPTASAQAQENATARSTGYVDLGIKTGSFLPYEIEGVTEVLPFWGIKIGHTVSSTLALEYDLDIAHAKGVTYLLGYFSLRHDFVVGQVLPLFFLIGADAHYFKKKDSPDPVSGLVIEHPWKFFGGWHAGVGTETVIYGDIWLRADVRMGFSPGRQLSVALTGIYRF